MDSETFHVQIEPTYISKYLPGQAPAAVLTAALAFLGYYNYRATGDSLLLPYRMHEMRCGVAPLFVFGGLRPAPAYTDERFRRYWAEWDSPLPGVSL